MAEKLINAEDIPNFSPITGQDKGKINRARINLLGLLVKRSRKNGLNDFLTLSKHAKLYENLEEIEDIRKYYPEKEDYEAFLKIYSEETFFYKIMNKGLRILL